MAAPRKFQVIIAFAALYTIWGSTYLGILFAIQSIPPFLMAGIRYLFAGAIMFAIAWGYGARSSSISSWLNSAIVGACLILVGNGGVTIAEKYVATGLASLIVATVPIYMILLTWISGMSPRPRPIIWLGLVGGFTGVALLLGPALTFHGVVGGGDTGGPRSTIPATTLTAGTHPAIGMSILLFSSFIWSVGSLYSRRATHGAASSPFFAAAQQMVCGGLLLVLTGTVTGEWPDFHPGKISILSIGAFAYLVLIGAVVGFTAYIWLLHHCDPAKVATYAYVNPIVAVLLGAAFAGETLTPRTIIAAALIIGSVALVITVQQLRAPSRASPIPPTVPEAECAR
jgi:drug/metabolite transporter (DMT)-like permease